MSGILRGVNGWFRNTHGKILGSSGRNAQTSSSTLTFASGTAYAYYADRAGEDLSSIAAVLYISGTPASGTGWAEIAVAKGTRSPLGATQSLTILGYASIDTEAKAGATQSFVKTISGLSIQATDDLWIIAACSYATTQITARVVNGDGDRSGVGCRRANCRPSTNLNTPLTFTYTAGQTVPLMWLEVP